MRTRANANAKDGVHAADDGAHAPENEVNISSTFAQLRILIRLIHHVQLRCLIRLSEFVALIVGRVVRIEASCDSIVGNLDPWLD